MALGERLRNGWRQVAAALRRGLATVFGEIEWRRPRWLDVAGGVAVRRGSAAAAAIRANPRASAGIAVAIAALVVGGSLAYRWYQNRPQPVLISFAVTTPAITCYACDPPGAPNPLVVTFDSSVAPLDRVGHAIEPREAGITMSPQVAGQWTWDDDKQLRFQPQADWPIARHFQVDFARRGFVTANVRLADYELGFDTVAFEAKMAGTEFHQDPVVASNKKVVATLAFSHPVDPESFERRVELEMFDRVTATIEKKLTPPTYTVIYDKLKLNAYVHSAQLEVPPKEGRLAITIKPGVHAARGGNETRSALTTNVVVPGLNSLEVSSLSLDLARDERNEPNQVLVLSMSHSVLERDMPAKLSAWLLPVRHPDPKLQQPYGNRAFRWSDSTVRPDLLTDQSKLELTQIPGEREHYELHSFRYTADPGRSIYVRVQSGLKSFGGYNLGDPVEQVLTVPDFPRELSILHEGALLSMSGDKTLSLFARNVPAMRVDVGRLLPRQLQHLVTQTSGSFATPQFNGWNFDDASITERMSRVVRLAQVDPGKPQYEAFDLGSYLDNDASDRRGVFLVRVRAWNPENDRALEYGQDNWNGARHASLSDARLIVVTDLGLVAKRSIDGGQDVFVQSIANGTPLAGVAVDVIGRNGLAVLTETTDAAGHVHFPDLKTFTRERQPVLYLARRGGDSSFLPLDERGRTLDLSRFDVGGVESNAERTSLAAYVFSDRGLYRPGEEIRAAAIIRSQDWNRKFEGVPLRLEVTDPRGTVIRRETFVPGAAGFGEIRQPTKETSPTGTYTLSVSIVRNVNDSDLIGSTTVQVRDFLPDRLRMRASFSAESSDGWVSPDALTVAVHLENLFGTPAEKRRISAQLSLTPSFPSFRAFPDHQFYDPQYAKEGFDERLADTTTDASGNAQLELNLQRFARATYRVHVIAQGFEADGGRGVTSEAAQLVSSMPYLIGYKADGDLAYLARGAVRTVNLIAIDNQAKRAKVDDLKLARLELRYVSVLMRQPNGTFKYESRRKESQLDETPLAIADTGLALALPTDTPGNFAYVVRDASGLQLARFDYQVTGEGNVTRALEKNAELELTLAKHDYVPGDEVEVSIRAPYAGAGLITIERERVYAWRWFKTTTTSSVQRIKLPQGLEGNAYVAVTFVRDAGSPEIYVSPLSYGVQPFSIDVDARRNPLTIEAPALVKPGQVATFRYSSARPSRLVLFAVDEGILQVAAYKTPDPLAHFFQKRALEVATTQILDLILPEFRLLGLDAAPGGDAEALLGKHLNPFRRKGEQSVAYWSGILDADSTPREVQYTVPDYFNGTLRVMAVAVADDRVGVHDSRTIVRGDFVLSPNAPTTVTPGDEFDVSLGVSNNVQGSGPSAQVSVALATDRGLEVVGDARQQIAIGENRESSVRFHLRARDELGPSDLRFTAQLIGMDPGLRRDGDGSAAAAREIDLSIRPATPFMTTLAAGVLDRGERDVVIDRVLYPHHRKLETGISVLPLSFAHGFVSYLANYPYACTEQIVSQAMPSILLTARPEFGYVRAQAGADLPGLLGELRSRQNDVGAYKLWPGGDTVVEFVSLYTQHALLEAGERGQPIPADLTANGNTYLRSLAARDGDNLTAERQSAYAIYLLTRQGQRMTAEIAAQRRRLTERYRDQWEQDLTAAWLAATLDLVKQDRDAEALISRLRFGGAAAYETYYDPMTRDAFLLYVLAKHFPERLRNVPADVFTTLARRVTDGTYHSLSVGTTLLALDAYAAATEGAARNLSIAEVLRSRQVRALTLPQGLFPKTAFTDQAGGLRFANQADVNAFYVIEQSGFDRTPPRAAIRQGLEVLREYTDASGKPLTKIPMGEQIDVHLKFRGLTPSMIGNVALVDLLPGGFELVIPTLATATPFVETSSEEGGETTGEDAARYPGGFRCQLCVSSKASLSYADMREDRVVFYVDASNEVSEIVYRIKATNVGTYTVPPAYGEAMYDRSVSARSVSGKIEVARAQSP